MKRGRHHFHCTGGRLMLPDLRGTYVMSADDLAVKAQRWLRGLRAALPDGLDWSRWMVDVHDAKGRHVAFVDFEPDVGWGADAHGAADELRGPTLRASTPEVDADAPGGGID